MKHEESKIQQQCVNWFRYQYPQHVMFAIPNGGRRGKVEAAIMKGEGVLAGVADLFIMSPKYEKRIPPIHGLFIEMKTEKGKQTHTQTAFECSAIMRGYQYAICRSLDEFMKVVNEYMQ